MRGCPPQTPPVGQGRTPETRLGCAGGGGWRGGGWRVEGVEGGGWRGGGVGRVEGGGWRVEGGGFLLYYIPLLFNLSRMSLMRDCWEATVASRLETWFSNSAMRALSACCCLSTSWSAAVATIDIASLFNIL